MGVNFDERAKSTDICEDKYLEIRMTNYVSDLGYHIKSLRDIQVTYAAITRTYSGKGSRWGIDKKMLEYPYKKNAWKKEKEMGVQYPDLSQGNASEE